MSKVLQGKDMKKICIVYKFTNTVTGDFYIGSRNNIKKSLANRKYQSVWISIPNEKMYQDIQKYGVDNFDLEVLEVVEPEQLKEVEQQFIETLKPTYNQMNEKDLDVERRKEYQKSDKGKESQKKAVNKYQNQLCSYNGETLTLNALSMRFRRKGIPHPTIEAKKYLKDTNPIEFYDVYP